MIISAVRIADLRKKLRKKLRPLLPFVLLRPQNSIALVALLTN
jgi:hypothetical protein